MHMHGRTAPLDLGGEVEVGRAGQIGMDAALHAHLGGTRPPCLLGPVPHLPERERVRVGVGPPVRTEQGDRVIIGKGGRIPFRLAERCGDLAGGRHARSARGGRARRLDRARTRVRSEICPQSP
jgi:hypothetical protein